MTSPVKRYVRYSANGKTSYGILEEDSIQELKGNFLDDITPTGITIPRAEARLLAPCEPSKVLAVGRNYQSHLGERMAPASPGVFLKLPSCIIGPGEAIVIPPGAADVSTMRRNLLWFLERQPRKLQRKWSPHFRSNRRQRHQRASLAEK
jgi:Rv2993c-like, N-terminal